MPVVDEDGQRLERRAPRWPWLLIGAAVALVWLLAAVAISLTGTDSHSVEVDPPTAVSGSEERLAQAESAFAYGHISNALQELAALDEASLNIYQKHRFLQIAAPAHAAAKETEESLRAYERLLRWGRDLHKAECQSCHATTLPTRLTDTQASFSGEGYVQVLSETDRLDERWRELRSEMAQKPEDPGPVILLYQIERARDDHEALAALRERLEQMELTRPAAFAAPPAP
jgi:hypothetical protein